MSIKSFLAIILILVSFAVFFFAYLEQRTGMNYRLCREEIKFEEDRGYLKMKEGVSRAVAIENYCLNKISSALITGVGGIMILFFGVGLLVVKTKDPLNLRK